MVIAQSEFFSSIDKQDWILLRFLPTAKPINWILNIRSLNLFFPHPERQTMPWKKACLMGLPSKRCQFERSKINLLGPFSAGTLNRPGQDRQWFEQKVVFPFRPRFERMFTQNGHVWQLWFLASSLALVAGAIYVYTIIVDPSVKSICFAVIV